MARKRRADHEGSVYRLKSGSWRATVSTWDRGGKRKRLTKTSKVRAVVADWLAARLAEQGRGLLVEPSRQTLAQFLETWLRDSVAGSVAPRTLEYYSRAVGHIVPTLGRVPLAKLTPQDVQRLYRQLQKAGLTRTVGQVCSTLRRSLDLAVKWGLLSRNPAHLVDRPKVPVREMKVLDADQAGRLLEAAEGHRLGALVVLALTTGARAGELFALRWSDLDFDRGTLRIQRALARRPGGGFEFTEPKTAGSRRTVTLPAAALVALRKHKALQAAERLAAGPDVWQDPALMFTTAIGTPLSKSTFTRRVFKPLLKAAGLPDVRLNDLRHTAASLLLAAGLPVNVVSATLGHSKATVTLNVYGHLLPDSSRRAAEAMDSILAVSRKKT